MIMVFVCLAVSDCTLIARKHAITFACVAICAMKVVNKRRDNQFRIWTHAPHKKLSRKTLHKPIFTYKKHQSENFVVTYILTDITDRFVKVASISHIQKLNSVGCEETFPETSRSKLESKKPNASKTLFATITKEIIMGGRKILRNAHHFWFRIDASLHYRSL